MPKGVMVVRSAPSDPVRDDEFNAWYDTVHLPAVQGTPGVVSVRRYQELAGDGYLAIYEIDADDIPTVVAAIRARSTGTPVALRVDPPPDVTVYELIELPRRGRREGGPDTGDNSFRLVEQLVPGEVDNLTAALAQQPVPTELIAEHRLIGIFHHSIGFRDRGVVAPELGLKLGCGQTRLVEEHPGGRFEHRLGKPVAEVDDASRRRGSRPLLAHPHHVSHLRLRRLALADGRVGDHDRVQKRQRAREIDHRPRRGGGADTMGRRDVGFRQAGGVHDQPGVAPASAGAIRGLAGQGDIRRRIQHVQVMEYRGGLVTGHVSAIHRRDSGGDLEGMSGGGAGGVR